MNVLVIGSAGFLGTHLSHELVERGHRVEGWSRRAQRASAGFTPYAVDLLVPATIRDRRGPWDAAFVLAGHAVPSRASSLDSALENVAMLAAAVEHLCDVAPGARTVVMSSGHVYAASDRACVETDATAPAHNYGRSKLLCETWALARKASLDVHVVRSFNQLGPNMPAGLLLPDVVQALASDPVELPMHGSDDTRDFLDVRDGVRALADLLSVDAPSGSVWNLCSGRGVRVSALVKTLMRCPHRDRGLVFDCDTPDVRVGSPDKLERATGWRARHTLEDTLAAVVHGIAAVPRPDR